MGRLRRASREQIREIYRESFALWGAGLTETDYHGLWDDLSGTAWGRERSEFYLWLSDEETILSSLKLYRPRIRVQGRVGDAAVLGAVFTPAAHRGRGHATESIREVLRQREEADDLCALLFSDIGTQYYRDLGFEPMPAEEHWGPLPRFGHEGRDPSLVLRPSTEADMPKVIEAHDAFCEGLPIAILRDRDHWEFLQTRSDSYFRRLGDRTVRHGLDIAEENGSFVGYCVSVEGRGEWNLREVGAVGGDLDRMERIVRRGAADARERGMRRVYGWLPPGLPERLPEWRLRSGPRRRARPMIQGLAERKSTFVSANLMQGFLPYQDQF